MLSKFLICLVLNRTLILRFERKCQQWTHIKQIAAKLDGKHKHFERMNGWLKIIHNSCKLYTVLALYFVSVEFLFVQKYNNVNKNCYVTRYIKFYLRNQTMLGDSWIYTIWFLVWHNIYVFHHFATSTGYFWVHEYFI